MAIPEPTFDTRKYREILAEALARIPVHNPEWNNFNDSDPGVTLLQLFAFMTESLIYRANRIPERNRRKFLRLLGVPMRAAEAAKGMVAFQNPKGRLEAVTLAAGQEVLAGKVPFRTLNGLSILPVEARVYYKSRLVGERRAEAETLYKRLYASFEQPARQLDFYETKVFEPPAAGATLPAIDLAADTVDGLWLALLARAGDDPAAARKALAGTVLTLGILPALDEEGCVLYPVGQDAAQRRAGLIFEVPNTQAAAAAYERLTPRTDGDPLREPSVVELALGAENRLSYWQDLDPLEAGVGAYPPSLEDDADAARLITWIRIRLPKDSLTQGSVSVKLSWIGINAAKVIQRARVAGEILPSGTGEPDQTAALANTPVIPDSVRLTVNGEVWEQIDDLIAADPEVPPRGPRLSSELVTADKTKVYMLDRESGEIRFGDGAHGMRPPRGSVIQASYDYGGGVQGLVGIGSINKGAALPSGITVSNPVPTWGGAEGETVEQAEKRVPSFLRHRDRLVSEEDFAEITWNTPGVELGRVEILSLFHPDLPRQDSPGVVTVLVIPKTDPQHPQAPEPDRLFLQTVCEYLWPRRLLTTELHVRGPEYRNVWVSAAVEVTPGRDQGPVLAAVRAEIEKFLSPLTGGFEATGWPREKPVDAGQLAAVAARVSGVAKVTGLLLGDDSGERTAPLELSGLQMPRLMGISVTGEGDPISIEDLRGETVSETAADTAATVPVPIIPESC